MGVVLIGILIVITIVIIIFGGRFYEAQDKTPRSQIEQGVEAIDDAERAKETVEERYEQFR